jgi:hypothetical protein
MVFFPLLTDQIFQNNLNAFSQYVYYTPKKNSQQTQITHFMSIPGVSNAFQVIMGR